MTHKSSACDCDTNHVARVRSGACPPSEIGRPIDATHCEPLMPIAPNSGSIWCPSSPVLAAKIAERQSAPIPAQTVLVSCQSLVNLRKSLIHVDRSPEVDMVSGYRVRGPRLECIHCRPPSGKGPSARRDPILEQLLIIAALGEFIVRVAIAPPQLDRECPMQHAVMPTPPFRVWNSLLPWADPLTSLHVGAHLPTCLGKLVVIVDLLCVYGKVLWNVLDLRKVRRGTHC